MAFMPFVMAAMTTAAPYLAVASTVLSAGAAIQSGRNQKTVAAANQAAANRAAIQQEAEGIARANVEREKATLLASRVSAIAAASGASGFGIDRILADIEERGERQAGYATYEAESQAAATRYRGAVGMAEARMAQRQANLSAVGTLLGGLSQAGTLYSKFSGGSAPAGAGFAAGLSPEYRAFGYQER